MRSSLFIAFLLLVLPASAWAQVEAPVDTDDAGGTTFVAKPAFSLAPGTVTAGSPVTVSVRIHSTARVRVLVEGVALKLGRVRAEQTVTRRWTPALEPGTYVARLRVGGHRVATFPLTISAPAPVAALSLSGVFPIRGAWQYGDPFGVDRPGHTHAGQDVMAAEGTPLVSPVSGSVFWRKVQSGGAGHYLVIRGSDGTDYVFMHLVAGSEMVDKGDTVKPGTPIGQVGSTGDATGPHLHFEIWPDGWYAPGSAPIDPLPQLKAWAAGSR